MEIKGVVLKGLKREDSYLKKEISLRTQRPSTDMLLKEEAVDLLSGQVKD
jgi:hypothetical protein